MIKNIKYFSSIVIVCWLFLIQSFICFANEKPAFVKTDIKAMDSVYAGQRVPFYVTLYAKSRFTGSPKFDLPDISGMILMELEDRPVLGSTREGEVEYLSKTHEFAFFPQREDNFTIPSFNISFAYVDASNNKPIETTYKTNEIKLDVTRPPGTESVDYLISTSEFILDESWDPKPDSVKVGDAFKRTITRTAKDIPGMVFLPVIPEKVSGLGVYENRPSVQDNMERGQFTGKRIESISYVCEQEGSYTIPGFTFYWFDTEKKELKKETLDSIVLEVAPNPQNINEERMPGKKKNPFRMPTRFEILMILGILLILWGILKNKKDLVHKYSTWNQARLESEKTFFKEFEKACQADDDKKAIQKLFSWLEKLVPDQKSLSAKALFENYHDAKLLSEFKVLENRLYNASKNNRKWDGQKFLKYVKQFRKQYLKKHRYVKQGEKSLEALNP